MSFSLRRRNIHAATALLAIGVTVGVSVASGATASAATATPLAATPPTTIVTVGAPTGARIPSNFLGLSLETFGVWRSFAPGTADTLAADLGRLSDPGGPQEIRIGGSSTDESWWSGDGQPPDPGDWYGINQGWLDLLTGYAARYPTRFSLGVNLASLDAGNAAALAAHARATLGSSLRALELGNEPDSYDGHLLTRNVPAPVTVRPAGYNEAAWESDWRAVAPAVAAAAPGVPVVGPTTHSPSWVLSALADGVVTDATFHRYGTSACGVTPSSPWWPTTTRLLSEESTHGMGTTVAPLAAAAHAAGGTFDVSETNSVACAGVNGVSDTFASALWASDTLFELATAGVDQVDVHTASATYSPLVLTANPDGTTSLVAQPEYYGLLAFRQAAPAGAQLLAVTGVPAGVKVWATTGTDGTTRIMVIDKTAAPVTVPLVLGHGSLAGVQVLTAPSVDATTGATFNARTVDPVTGALLRSGTGHSAIRARNGVFTTTLDPYSALVLTVS